MKPVLVAFASGLVFALGLAISGMTLPANILAFLDITGAWDPSLALVMGSALAVLALMRLLAPSKPLLATAFAVPPARGIDARLVTGAAIFGIGWGLGGFCPGPSIVALGALCPSAVLFVAAMAAGMLAHKLFERVVPESESAFEVTSEVKPETCG